MLYLIGLGLDSKDISLNALEAIKKCKKVYLESYTSFGFTVKEIEKIIKRKIIVAERELIENNSDNILKEAKKQDIGILVYGDPLFATTHINYLIDAKKDNIKFKIIHSSSILNAIAETGLSLYNFGKTTSIPFNNESIITPVNVIKDNLKLGLHTLILLDLDPKNKRFLTISHALEYLSRNNINLDCIACSALGTSKQEIRYGSIEKLKKLKFNKYPQCLIIPGKLHFIEEEALNFYKI
ncbi:MAG: diphthine synthase [Nanoarchaeota archaeon]